MGTGVKGEAASGPVGRCYRGGKVTTQQKLDKSKRKDAASTLENIGGEAGKKERGKRGER